MRRATIAASSPTPISSDDFRFRRKWTPRKYSPGAAVDSPSTCRGKPRSSNAPAPATQEA
jgi:hypothetical protein